MSPSAATNGNRHRRALSGAVSPATRTPDRARRLVEPWRAVAMADRYSGGRASPKSFQAPLGRRTTDRAVAGMARGRPSPGGRIEHALRTTGTVQNVLGA